MLYAVRRCREAHIKESFSFAASTIWTIRGNVLEFYTLHWSFFRSTPLRLDQKWRVTAGIHDNILRTRSDLIMEFLHDNFRLIDVYIFVSWFDFPIDPKNFECFSLFFSTGNVFSDKSFSSAVRIRAYFSATFLSSRYVDRRTIK